MTDIVERLRYTASVGIPDFTNSRLLDEAADEIERLRTTVNMLLDGTAMRDPEIKRLRALVETLEDERRGERP